MAREEQPVGWRAGCDGRLAGVSVGREPEDGKDQGHQKGRGGVRRCCLGGEVGRCRSAVVGWAGGGRGVVVDCWCAAIEADGNRSEARTTSCEEGAGNLEETYGSPGGRGRSLFRSTSTSRGLEEEGVVKEQSRKGPSTSGEVQQSRGQVWKMLPPTYPVSSIPRDSAGIYLPRYSGMQYPKGGSEPV